MQSPRVRSPRRLCPLALATFLPLVVAAAVAAALSLTVGSPPAIADDTSVGRDIDGVYPVQSVDVEMVAENVTIDLFTPEEETSLPGICSRARCEFVFRNTSAQALDVLMAFPAEAVPMGDYPTQGLAVRDFKAFVKTAGDQAEAPGVEEELPVALEPASAGPPETAGSIPAFSSWYTFTVPFGPGETRTVINTYWAQNSYNSISEVWVRYILETGRNWSGPIGDATVTLNLGEIRPEYIDDLYPGDWRFTPDGTSLVWHRSGFEPNFNLAVRYNVRAWDGRNDTRPERKAELGQIISDGPGLSQDELLEAHERAIAANDLVKAALIRAFLPEGRIPSGKPVITDVSVRTPQGSPVLRVAYLDLGGDLASIHIEVTHQQQGQTVVDFDIAEADRWVGEERASGEYTLRLGDQPAYQVVVTLEDAAGLKATKSATLTLGQGGGSGQGTGAAWIVAGAALVIAAIAGALLAWRSRRPRRPESAA